MSLSKVQGRGKSGLIDGRYVSRVTPSSRQMTFRVAYCFRSRRGVGEVSQKPCFVLALSDYHRTRDAASLILCPLQNRRRKLRWAIIVTVEEHNDRPTVWLKKRQLYRDP